MVMHKGIYSYKYYVIQIQNLIAECKRKEGLSSAIGKGDEYVNLVNLSYMVNGYILTHGTFLIKT
jgi:hypothetical protein